jgi:transposase-like protein
MYYLTPQQIQVADALSNGASLTGAAAEAGIHRNTIANWRRESQVFRDALTHATYYRAILCRDRAIELADLAFEAIRKVLTNPDSSPSALLRAAIFIIDKVSTPPVPEKENHATMADLFAAMEPPAAAQKRTTVHNDAQPEPEAQPNHVLYVHNSAQPPQPYRRPEPKTGRNELCPCGSGRKHKHCCLNKTAAACT